jgi:hypothetical protein
VHVSLPVVSSVCLSVNAVVKPPGQRFE